CHIISINVYAVLDKLLNLTFAYILFRETLSAGQLAAFTFLLSGGILASLHLGGGKWRWSKALGTMLVACLFYSGYALTFDRLSIFFDPLSTWFWSGILVMAMSPLFLLNGRIRNDFQTMIKGLGRTAWLTIFGINFLDSGATLLNMLALALGPVALVYSLEGTQIIFVFLMTIFLTLRAPKILKEQLNKENLWLKIVALIFMVVGTVMIYYNK
ncbi:MAG TPA: hypothetical protein PLR18_03545, partial [bacterium]|nr:hypothetical protein [bacterium]